MAFLKLIIGPVFSFLKLIAGPVAGFWFGRKSAKAAQTKESLENSRERHDVEDWARRADNDDLDKWL